MLRISIAAALPLVVMTTAAAAQTETASQAAAPQQSAVRANTDAAQSDAARAVATETVNADAQAQYAADMTAYQQALARRDRQADRTQAYYDHQQRAYADAMAAWRAQDYACRHGSSRACNTPAPDPSAFW